MGRYNALGSIDRAHPHGTAVAEAIVAHARLTGVAANILAIRALDTKDSTAEATSYGINKGLVWALSNGARIINMSFTGPRDPLDRAKGGAAAPTGNCPDRSRRQCRSELGAVLPGGLPRRDCGSGDRCRRLALFRRKSRQPYCGRRAGDRPVPAGAGRGYQVKTGTSFAVAEVSGIVPLLLEC
jgi:subtilisin family serine protease